MSFRTLLASAAAIASLSSPPSFAANSPVAQPPQPPPGYVNVKLPCGAIAQRPAGFQECVKCGNQAPLPQGDSTTTAI
jgi:hypothetical protein